MAGACAAAGLAAVVGPSPLCCLPHLPEGRQRSLSRAGRTRCASTSQPGILPQATTETRAGSSWQRHGKRQVWAGASLAAAKTHAHSPLRSIPAEHRCDATDGRSQQADFKGTNFSLR